MNKMPGLRLIGKLYGSYLFHRGIVLFGWKCLNNAIQVCKFLLKNLLLMMLFGPFVVRKKSQLFMYYFYVSKIGTLGMDLTWVIYRITFLLTQFLNSGKIIWKRMTLQTQNLIFIQKFGFWLCGGLGGKVEMIFFLEKRGFTL